VAVNVNVVAPLKKRQPGMRVYPLRAPIDHETRWRRFVIVNSPVNVNWIEYVKDARQLPVEESPSIR
jgi:hypothetical protein